MKKVIITENQLEKIRSIINGEFDRRLSPTHGWDDFEKQMKNNEDALSDDSTKHFVGGDVAIDTYDEDGDEDDNPYYYYYSCLYIDKHNLEGIECPSLMLHWYDYDFFDKRFPSDLWKSFLIDWWNSHTNYPVVAVYKHPDIIPR